MEAEAAGIRTIKIINSIVSNAILVIIVALVAFAGYALWDSKQIFKAADKSNYSVYKPTEESEGKTFKELQIINPEVIAWLDVYGTNIDYPVTQGEDNMKYVSTNAEGRYSLSGAIFLDSDNSKDFSDFNNILYGHHMEKEVMFGEIGSFAGKDVFDSHRYGNLYFEEKDHGIEFFAFIHADAYDRSVFSPNIDETDQKYYLKNLIERAIHKRDIEISASDRIVLLTTCSSNSTNGRDILVGKITDEVFEDPFKNAETDGGKTGLYGLVEEILMWPLLLALVLVIRIIVLIKNNSRRIKNLKKVERKEEAV